MLEPPRRLVPSEVNLLGARAGTESVSTPSNVIADARLVHARSCELPEMPIQLQVVIRSTAFKRDFSPFAQSAVRCYLDYYYC